MHVNNTFFCVLQEVRALPAPAQHKHVYRVREMQMFSPAHDTVGGIAFLCLSQFILVYDTCSLLKRS